MDSEAIINQLSRNCSTFAGQLLSLTKDEYTWRPAPDKWCLLEVVCHLVDEEVEDFRQRVQTTLETPGEQPPAIFPEKWVKDRNYMEENYVLKVAQFLEERSKSIAWLQGLTEPNWENAYEHDSLGTLSAGLFLENWLAHDYIHLRQILLLRMQYFKEQASSDLSYAGNW